MAQSKLLQLSPQALFRYQLISAVQARVLAGMGLSRAVREVVEQAHRDERGQLRKVSERSLYRWLDAFEQQGLEGLEPEPRPRIAESTVLPAKLLNFLRTEKEADREASVPELIRRARLGGILGEDEPVSRVSLWRACRRMGLPLQRVRRPVDQDMRAWAYPHRMLMVLADGKHFRAGLHRLRRVALHFLDDATRYGLAAVVGTSETTELFLHGLHTTISRWGRMKALYLDRGPGFISQDTHQIVARLDIKLIHGTAHYPEGHAKVERFHWTAYQHHLRGLDRNPEIDPTPSALELRLSHWLYQVYNHNPHESLDQQSPHARWHSDPRELDFPGDRQWLDDQFLLTEKRRVSHDNLVPYNGIDYEVPRGHAGENIEITRHLLDGTLSIVHEGRRVVLHPVDRTTNAYTRRAAIASAPATEPPAPAHTAATLAFKADFQPLVDHEGNYPKGQDHDN
jgi:putative transposase